MIETPLLAEIRRLHEEKQTGMLTLANASGEKVDVFFREGAIEAASSNLNSRRLGDYLVKLGHLAAHDLDVVLAEARKRRIFFGEAAVLKNLADPASVGAAVKNQVLELVGRVVRDGFTVESFTSCLKFYYAPAHLTFANLLLELARTGSAPYEAQPGEKLVIRDLVDILTFPWSPEELCILNALHYPQPLEELRESTGLPPMVLTRSLGVLQAVGAVGGWSAAESSGRAVAHPLVPERLIPVVPCSLDEKLDVARNGNAYINEQFKNLKVLLTEANTSTPLKVLTVSSPDAQDGKSFVSANLAFSFAMDHDRRVLIIDCDLRKPSLDRYLGVPLEPGLLQYLSSNGRMEPHCYLRRTENLYFMTAGGTALNPIEILSMEKMRHLVDLLKREFDTIILDAPPYSPIADARVVTGLSDGLIMVVRRGKTRYSSSDRAFKAVDRTKLLGVVLNDVKPMPFQSGYNSFDYYGYGQNPQVNEGQAARKGSYLES